MVEKPSIIKVCVAGATGDVGKVLIPAIIDSADLQLVGAVSRKNKGKSLGALINKPELNLFISSSVQDALKVATDVLVDYTSAIAVKENVITALEKGVSVVIGSSGLTENDYAEIDQFAKSRGLGVFAAGNFAITAVLLQHFAGIAARYVPHWEIIDYCRAEKIDAPSGTTRELAHKLSQIRQANINVPIEKIIGDKHARGASLNGSQVHSVRLPSFLFSGEVIFALPGERLSLRHDAVDSGQPYVSGTLLAIRKVLLLKGLARGLERFLDL